MIHPEPVDFCDREDYYGNRVSFFSIDQAHRGLTVTAASQVTVSTTPETDAATTPPWEKVVERLRTDRSADTFDAYQFVSASPSVPPLSALRKYAETSFTTSRPILEAAIDLTSRIYHDFTYSPRSTTIHTPISEVFEKRRGVCQDFAHLQISCLRSLGLAARYVSGYLRTLPPPGKPRLVGADASHAWLSIYCGAAGWVDLDPTNNSRVRTDHITVAWGREYSDVCPIQGVIVGGGDHSMHVSVDVAPEDEKTTQP